MINPSVWDKYARQTITNQPRQTSN